MKITDAEAIYTARKRRGESQAEAGARYGVSQMRYSELERAGGGGVIPVPDNVTWLTDTETCALLRRRLGMTRARAALSRGVSAQTVYKWETTKCEGTAAWVDWLKQRAGISIRGKSF